MTDFIAAFIACTWLSDIHGIKHDTDQSLPVALCKAAIKALNEGK